jgi:hypothetical protein
MKKLLPLAVAGIFAAATPSFAQPALPPTVVTTLCGVLKGANFNTTADQAITITPPSATYTVSLVRFAAPSVSMTTAAGGMYTGTGKTGLAFVPAATAYTGLTTSALNTAGYTTTVTPLLFGSQNTTVYLSLTTAQGVAATADVYVHCTPFPS